MTAHPAALAEPALGGWWRPVGVGLRWGAIAIGVVVSLVTDPAAGATAAALGVMVLAAVALWRTLPAMGADRLPVELALLVEGAITLAVIIATGGWSSPLGVSAVVPVMLAVVSRGWRAGLAAVAGLTVALSILDVLGGDGPDVTGALQLLTIVLAGAAAGWAISRAVEAAEEEHERTLGRVQQLGHVNAMLSTLHDLVRSVPAPLTVDEIVRVIRGQLEELFDADAVVLLLADGGGGRWRPVHAEGIRLPSELTDADLPEPVRRSGPHQRPLIVPHLEPGEGLWPEARSGAYLWLWMRGQPSALLLLEHAAEDATAAVGRDTLERLGVPLALAIDNAVWFQRLRTLGAEEERQRIGAELHDRFAQSLAYVAMSLDRVAAAHPGDATIETLRTDVRGTLLDLRETLRELRVKVTDERSLQQVLGDHLARFSDRFGVLARLEVEGEPVRPALPVEQQVLRIVQDLVNLAQRESCATVIDVRYVTGPGWLSLSVGDDGLGIHEPELGREAAERLAVVRDRADAIGASVVLDTVRGEGTTVTVTLRGLM